MSNTKILWFHTLQFYNNSKDTKELDSAKVEVYHEKIEKILDSGKVLIGALNTWILPEFANAPKVPGEDTHLGVRVVRRDAIPPFDADEYLRLIRIRAELFKQLAAEFSEINTWIIGFEANYFFKDLAGNDLDLNSYGDFILDTLESARKSVTSVNADAITICHFLGRVQHPITISGELIQPSQILELINEKIQDRGKGETNYFDRLISDFEPGLADDREEKIPGLIKDRSVGWHTKWWDSFGTTTSDLTGTYNDWEDVRTTITILDVAVANGDARCYLTVPENENDPEIAGAKTVGVTVVPSSTEFNGNSSYRNYWTGVMDFRTIDKTTDDSFEHAEAFIRVNNRTWDTIDQTRIGTIVWTDSNIAQLQFTGDDASDPSEGLNEFIDFYISDHPFDDQIFLWRLQIHEREYYTVGVGWELEWKAEIWKDPYDAGRERELVGATQWTDEEHFESAGIDIPELSGSGYLFALIGSDGAEGEMDNERSATSYWEY